MYSGGMTVTTKTKMDQLQEIRTNGGHRGHWHGDESTEGKRFRSYGSDAIINGEHTGSNMSYVNEDGDQVDGEAIPVKISPAFIRNFFGEDSVGTMFVRGDEDYRAAIKWAEEDQGRKMEHTGGHEFNLTKEDKELVSEYWVMLQLTDQQVGSKRDAIDIRLTQKTMTDAESAVMMMSVEQVLWFAETCEKMHNWLYTPASNSDDCWVHPDNGGQTHLELQALRTCNKAMMRRLEKIINRFDCSEADTCERCN